MNTGIQVTNAILGTRYEKAILRNLLASRPKHSDFAYYYKQFRQSFQIGVNVIVPRLGS